MDIKDIGIRALKTAVQAALAIFTVGVFTDVLNDTSTLSAAALAAGTAALAGAFSVIHNALLAWSNS